MPETADILTIPNVLPRAPSELVDSWEPAFAPGLDLAAWVRATFIDVDAPLVNPDHEHLQLANIGFLWANVSYVKRDRQILGEARLGMPTGSNAWMKGRTEQQMREWFEDVPDFLITLDAKYVAQADDAEICALIEHELMHCSQQYDEFGSPRFSRTTGLPVWAMRAHDVEQFIGVVERYGADAAHVQQLVDAANRGPTIARAEIAGACGTCLRKVA